MINSHEIIIPIPKKRNTHCIVNIENTNITSRVIKSKWIIPVTSGIGTFSITVSNSFGQFNSSFNVGDSALFYADNLDGSTLQFYGHIDYIKNDIGEDGQFLEIEGRHRSFLLTEFLVCHSATSTSTSQILKDIINKLPGGFTYNNVNNTTDSMDVQWNYKPFWDCVLELCNKGGFDCYVDDNLDFHYFQEDSISNSNEAIVEGDNFISTKDFGINSLYEKTRVTAIGQDNEGLPIIYTEIIGNEGSIREVFIKDASANTYEIVKNIAESKLAEISNRRPQAIIKSFGIETLKPGENLWIIVPRQQIAAQYKVIEISHEFGQESGGWRTECKIEEEESGIPQAIQKISKTTNIITQSDNVNKLNFSYNFPFDEDSGVHSNTEITDSVLKTDGSASGFWISPARSLSSNATQCELRAIGESLHGTIYYVSQDNGITWQSISTNTLFTFNPPGQNLKIKVELNSASTQIKSLALLYS